MEKKELYKKAREYLGKTVSYGIGNIEFDYDRPDGKEYIYEESQDDEDMENFAVMDFLEDLLVDFTKQELDRAREEGGESIIAQLSLSENMEKVERFFREAPIDYDDKCNLWFDFLSKLTTK